ncbi:CD151 antigen [Anthonomus grandis grandis]|uniref:CD151 antigen n=1 Tax=Anthonomus grandis grandis TaxID=2921223 RepID=UPI002165223A|nr:CD151 antigen [Anthonomus grandis grandis]
MIDFAKMKTCELSLIKYLLFGFNLVFAISGIVIIIVGALTLSEVGQFQHFMEGRILAPPVVLIVVGAIVFLVASLGCYGAIRESYYMLIAFAACLLVVFIIELAVGITAAVYHNEIDQSMKNVMDESLARYEKSDMDKNAWDKVQSELQCCGVSSPNDWNKTKRPLSCCEAPREGAPPPTEEGCNSAKVDESNILFSSGCFEKIKMKAENASRVLIGVGIGIALIEVIGILLACWMALSIKNRS